jgi:hypothetical protein
VCALYSDSDELARVVAEFLAEGLQRSERCWYVSASDDTRAVRSALQARGVDVAREMERDALNILSSSAAYIVDGAFNPELTMYLFNDAIEEALADGFAGFRAAANMSWALDVGMDMEQLITYEALLRALFSSARVTGLCLYDRQRMPLAVIDGALSTHPVVRTSSGYGVNAFYEPAVRSLQPSDPLVLADKLEQIDQ